MAASFSSWRRIRMTLLELVDDHSGDNHHAFNHHLPEVADAHHHHAVGKEDDDEGADN